MTVGLFEWGKRRFPRRGRDGKAGPTRERTAEELKE